MDNIITLTVQDEEPIELHYIEAEVKPEQEKSVVPAYEPQTVTPDAGFTLGAVNVAAMPTEIAHVTPGWEPVTVTPQEGKAFHSVEVDGMPEPTATETFDKNGTYEVGRIGTAIVEVPQGVFPSGTKQISITQNGTTTEDVTDYENAEIAVNVPVGVPNGEIVKMTYYEVVVGENTIATSGELKAYIDAAIGRTDTPTFASARKKESYLRYEFLGVRPVNVGFRYNQGFMDTFSYTGVSNNVNIPDGSIIDLYFLSWSLED